MPKIDDIDISVGSRDTTDISIGSRDRTDISVASRDTTAISTASISGFGGAGYDAGFGAGIRREIRYPEASLGRIERGEVANG